MGKAAGESNGSGLKDKKKTTVQCGQAFKSSSILFYLLNLSHRHQAMDCYSLYFRKNHFVC